MNIDNNHLISQELMDEMKKQAHSNLEKYVKVPKNLCKAAELELAGKKQTIVGKNASGSMSEFARKMREANTLDELTKKMREAKIIKF